VGGWDLVNGLPPGPKGPLSFDFFMRFAERTAPALAEWITPETMPGVRACFEALSQLHGARDAVLSTDFPVMIWDGRSDSYHDQMQAFAVANRLPFLSSAGDHLAAVMVPSAETIKGRSKPRHLADTLNRLYFQRRVLQLSPAAKSPSAWFVTHGDP
jgi:hypothetical protein